MDVADLLPPLAFVVEDDERLRALVAGALRRHFRDFEVHECEDGRGAIDAVERFVSQGREIALAVTDLIMPGVDGLEVLDFVREKVPDCARVVLTGQGGVDAALATLRAGHDDFLQKPFREEALVRVLAGHVARRRADRRARFAEANLRRGFRGFANLLDAVRADVDPHLDAVLRRPDIGEGHRVALLQGRRDLQHIADAYRALVADSGPSLTGSEPLSLRAAVERSARAATSRHGVGIDHVRIVDAKVPLQAVVPAEPVRIVLMQLLDHALTSGTGRAMVTLLGEGRNLPEGFSADDLPSAVRAALTKGQLAVVVSFTAAMTRDDERYVRAVLSDDLDESEALRSVGLAIARLYAELLGGQVLFVRRPTRSEASVILLMPRGDTGVEGAPERW